ncbi:MAG: hypothetical protein D6715_14375 [Calditrichaeota bacterium]|nr:MAG: hypothetical protein D6715_14375 [Calditrichota bacterium]
MSALSPEARCCAALRPNLFPTIGDFLKIAAAGGVLFADHLPFARHSPVHRVSYPQRGRVVQCTLPVPRTSRSQPIAGVQVRLSRHWQRKLLVGLAHALGWAPFSEECLAQVEAVFRPGHHTLGDLLWANLRWQLNMAGFRQPCWRASQLGIADPLGLARWMEENGFQAFVCLPEEWPYYRKHFSDRFQIRVLDCPSLSWLDGLRVEPNWAAVALLCRWGRMALQKLKPGQ